MLVEPQSLVTNQSLRDILLESPCNDFLTRRSRNLKRRLRRLFQRPG